MSKPLLRLSVAGVAVLAMIVTAVTAWADSHDPLDGYRSQTLHWQPCEPDSPQLQCATLRAPRDWHHPADGVDITLAISRLAAPDPTTRRGILLLDGGGPASNLDLPLDFADLPIAGGYDLIGYDPRGIGRSTNITCLTSGEIAEYSRVDMRDRAPGNIALIRANAAATAQACAERSGELLRYVSTDQIVRDWDLIRTLLGEPKLNVLGFSAGTWFGAHYANTFPHRVGRMVLDSNTEFTASMQAVVDNQASGFERRFTEDFLPWIAEHDGIYHYGATAREARARWEARRAALPIPISATFTLRPADLDNITVGGLYHKNDFPVLAQLLSILERLDRATPEERQVVESVFSSPVADPDVLAMYLATTCNDTPWTRDPDFWVRHSGNLGHRYPLFGYQTLFQPCVYWPYQPPTPEPVTGAGAPTILMVNSVRDPATPYAGALRAHRQFRPSVLVTVLDEGDHINYGRNGNPCVDRAVHEYLLHGTLPRHDITCPGQPLPEPEAIGQVP